MMTPCALVNSLEIITESLCLLEPDRQLHPSSEKLRITVAMAFHNPQRFIEICIIQPFLS